MADKSTYHGKEISITFDGSRCIHARNCVLGQPHVFQANVEGPWIKPDNAPAEALVALAHTCPSGAITYERHDGAGEETAPDVNTIRVSENGPLHLRTKIVLDETADGYRATLCRCGASENKPYCDGSHHEIDFHATGEPATQESEPLMERSGELSITPRPNGPLLIRGNLEIISGTGRTMNRTQNTALCRCGASENKPYCDGTHREIGFKTD
ncbi:CDGSH iron-sulfur domain-containing protein [Chloroflexi bacterium TSY]|nr:CDGSH iron-sulfur domain-containing protein [Chloroflexi bacterium TSY]